MIKAIPTTRELKSLKRDTLNLKYRYKKFGLNSATNHKVAYLFKKLDRLAGI